MCDMKSHKDVVWASVTSHCVSDMVLFFLFVLQLLIQRGKINNGSCPRRKLCASVPSCATAPPVVAKLKISIY